MIYEMISSHYRPGPQRVEAGAERLAPPVKSFQRDRVLPRLKNSIANREAEIEAHVAEARRKSDSRVRRRSERLDAENELDEALVKLEEAQRRHRDKNDELAKRQIALRKEIDQGRLDVLVCSPPFVLKLEQALALVSQVGNKDNLVPPSSRCDGRWRSCLVALMKDVNDCIERRKHLSGGGPTSGQTQRDIDLAAASARLVSIHVNAWTTHELSCALSRVWMVSVKAEAASNPRLAQILEAWETKIKQLQSCSIAMNAATDRFHDVTDAAARVRDCQARVGLRSEACKSNFRKEKQNEHIFQELRHLHSKVVPMLDPAQAAARYNLLLMRCAEIGAWEAALNIYHTIRAQCTSAGEGRKRHKSIFPGPVVFQHLLRAAKLSHPPRPRAALSVLQEMRSTGQEISVSHYNIILSACALSSAVLSIGDPTRCGRSVPHDEICSIEGYGDHAHQAHGRKALIESSQNEAGTDEHMVDVNFGRSLNVTRKMKASHKTSAASEGRTTVLRGRQNTLALNTKPDESEVGGRKFSKEYSTFLSEFASPVVEPETAGDAWRLALDVIHEMRNDGIKPTEVTYRMLGETCKCAGGEVRFFLSPGELGHKGGSSPDEIYTALRNAGVPQKVCYNAGVGNALAHRSWSYASHIAKLSQQLRHAQISGSSLVNYSR